MDFIKKNKVIIILGLSLLAYLAYRRYNVKKANTNGINTNGVRNLTGHVSENKCKEEFRQNAAYYGVHPDKVKQFESNQLFVKNFNIVLRNIAEEQYPKPNLPYMCADTIKKGDRGEEVNKLETIINKLFKGNSLKLKGNYTNELKKMADLIFKNTGFYNPVTSEICKKSINNFYSFLN